MNKNPPDLQLPADIYQWILEEMLKALPPPLTDTPEACAERDRAAIAAVAAMAPANTIEASLCTHTVIADAYARDCVLRACEAAADLNRLQQQNRLAKQFARGARTWRALLRRTQAARLKRHAEKAPGAPAARPRRRKPS